MRQNGNEMICPYCGVTMNHHADKLIESTGPADAADVDPELGGICAEMFGCPRCGNAETRRAAVRA
jgi:predicted RNA-binding Zn-ribbon protein involved in translation (DUF1610 family)